MTGRREVTPVRRDASLGSDLCVAGGVLALAALTLWAAGAIPESPIYAQVGPRAVPYAIAGLLLVLGAGLTFVALRGGWSHALEDDPPPTNWRAVTLMLAGLAANLALIAPFGFALAASVQFVLVAAAFGSVWPARDAGVALVLTLAVWFAFTELLGVNIGAGLLEGLVLEALGRTPG